jgi:hypothetical protein
MKNAERDMTVLETQFKQRAYDGKWERIVKVLDEDNMYSYTNEYGSRVTMIPEKWITVGVYDYLLEIHD